MIYLDNAATTLMKPRGVYRAVLNAMETCGNPGRSGHKASLKAANVVFECRDRLCSFFNAGGPENVVFTHNATYALNMAIKGIMRQGDHAVVSCYEHNSVVRPLASLDDTGVTFTVAGAPLFDTKSLLENMEKAIGENTRCIICTHVSNVFGFILPIEQIDQICQKHRIALIIDAAQSAGVIKIDLKRLKSVAFICMPGHKSLFGPQGTGVLIKGANSVYTKTLIEGGTGSFSSELSQPEIQPDRFESGTLNVPGIAGLCEGVKYIQRIGSASVLEHEKHLTRRLCRGLSEIRGITPYISENPEKQCGVLSFNGQKPCEEISELLSDSGICVRSGMHCSPLAHTTAGTERVGTVRVSPSLFNTDRDVDMLLLTLHRMSGVIIMNKRQI